MIFAKQSPGSASTPGGVNGNQVKLSAWTKRSF